MEMTNEEEVNETKSNGKILEFKGRTRMIHVKSNYKNVYKELTMQHMSNIK